MKNKKGFFSLESAIAFMVILAIIIVNPIPEKNHFEDTLIQKKINDVFIVWNLNESDEMQIKEDAELFFGKDKIEIKINGKEIISKKSKEKPKEKISKTTFIFGFISDRKLEITVSQN